MEATEHLARALGLPFVDLASYSISCGILSRIGADLACRERCVPMVFNKTRVVLVVDDPFQGARMAANPQLLGAPYRRRVELALTTPEALDAALGKRVNVVR
jgi:hypothetical protein